MIRERKDAKARDASPARSPAVSHGAVVIGGDCGALAAVRSLGRRRIPVGVVRGLNPVASYSRFASWAEDWDGAESAGALDQLIALAEKRGALDWTLFPAGDAEVRLVSQNHAELSRLFRLTVPPWETLGFAADKHMTYARCASLGIPHPRTYAVRSLDDARALDFQFPLIVKPAEKQGVNALTAAKAWIIASREDLLRRFGRASDLAGDAGLIVQELIPGDDSSQFSWCALCENGVPLVTMAARRTRQTPAGFGTGTFVESMLDLGFGAHAERFLASINYTGLVEIEFKLDRRDNQFKLIDVNPRLWTWNGLGVAAGVDFAGAAFDLANGGAVEKAQGRPGASWLYVARDAGQSLASIRKGELSFAAYLRSLFGASAYATFAWDDPLPSLVDTPLALFRRGKRKA
ncbi:ATP-grasp domain-containing protein [Aestuariivirga sp.]|uniref:carboxylate--amine ligase n=1 Tax=Aestuariivirga sp. TaxID=2650926 RepID=UPI0039E3383E